MNLKDYYIDDPVFIKIKYGKEELILERNL
jgi:hypothetical protein